jgi:Domain of unknown function (DUF4266)
MNAPFDCARSARMVSVRLSGLLLRGLLGGLLLGLSACATVKPQERAVLADPVMQFEGDPKSAAQIRHAIENREGSYGGTSVSGGGCGCN